MSDGLRAKYIVRKTDTGEAIENCFVLRPEKDPAAIAAIRAYAAATTNSTLADDLIRWVGAPPNDPLTLCELREIIEQLEFCEYQCEGGPLNMNVAFIRLKEIAYRREIGGGRKMDYKNLIAEIRESNVDGVASVERWAAALESLLGERDALMDEIRGECRVCANVQACYTTVGDIPYNCARNNRGNWKWRGQEGKENELQKAD